MYEIEFHTRATKFLKKQNKQIRNRLLRIIYVLKLNPYPIGSKGILPDKNKLRIRIGKIRILYTIFKDENVIFIVDIDYRGRVYK